MRVRQDYSPVGIILTAICFFSFAAAVFGETFPGYTLYNPLDQYNTYLVNMNGTIVKTWNNTAQGGYVVHLLQDGSIMRPCRASPIYLFGPAVAGKVQKISWGGTVLWTYTYNTTQYVTHHDIEVMPNGNVLLIAWEVKTQAQATAAGRQNPGANGMWPDHIIEVQPTGATTGEIVWQWHMWDHLIQDYNPSAANFGVVREHPELLNINLGSGSGDWNHLNGVSYNPELDQIAFTSHNMNEIYIIDHSTTTAEAAGHTGGIYGRGGDFLYRWGKPSNYGHTGSQYFYVVHCAKWVPANCPGAGNLMAFNNGTNLNQSKVVELVLPQSQPGFYTYITGQAYGPTAPVWTYTATGFYSGNLGSCQRLPNGNTLANEATSGDFFEVNTAGATQWSYMTTSQIAKAYRYAWYYPGVVNLNALTVTMTPPGTPIQIPAEGGSFTFTRTMSNLLSSALNFDFWTEAEAPDSVYGPLLFNQGLVLNIGGTNTVQIVQDIPAELPPGSYTFTGNIGHYPDFVDDFDEFTFEKFAAIDNSLSISISNNNVILSWPQVSYADQYKIYYQDTPYFEPSGTPQAVVIPPDTSWIDVDALNSEKRYYRKVVVY